MEKKKMGKLYVVHNDCIRDIETDDVFYKIGITDSTVEKRYYGLGLKMPGEFVCDFAYEFKEEKHKKLEGVIHNILSQSKSNGEWFTCNEDVLDGLQELCVMLEGKLVTDEIEQDIEQETGKSVAEEKKTRRSPFRFDQVDCVPGTILEFVYNKAETCTVKDNRLVTYQGRDMTLTELTKELFQKCNRKYSGWKPRNAGIFRVKGENETLFEKLLDKQGKPESKAWFKKLLEDTFQLS